MKTFAELKAEGAELLAKANPTAQDAARMTALVEEMKAAKAHEDGFKTLVNALNGADNAHSYATGNGAKYLDLTELSKNAGDMSARMKRRAAIHGGDGVKALVGSSLSDQITLAPDVVADRPPLSFLERVPVFMTDKPVVRYMRSSPSQSNAAVVDKGELKPTTSLNIDDVDTSLRVVAHISDQVDVYSLSDHDALAGFMTNELWSGLLAAVEHQIINGAGPSSTPKELDGILNTSGISVAGTGAPDRVTAIRKGITALRVSGAQPSLIVLHPQDWEAIETHRTETGQFDTGAGPIDATRQMLWGVPVAQSVRIAAGTALVLDTSAVHIYCTPPPNLQGILDHEYGQTGGSLNVGAGYLDSSLGVYFRWLESGDSFERNAVKLRVEGRFQVAVTKTTGVCKVTLPTG